MGNKKQETKITKAVCQVCKWQNKENTNVDAALSFGGSYRNGEHYISNIIFNYWRCPKHGAVGALIRGKIIDKPLELFNGEIAIYEANKAFPAYSTTAEEFSKGLYQKDYKEQRSASLLPTLKRRVSEKVK